MSISPVGILGGTFDPVHFGHLRPALEVLQGLGLCELRLVPGRIPPHRASPKVDPNRRLQMLHLATESVPGLAVDDRELRRAGPSFTVDTLHSLRLELGERPLCFLMGSDAFLGLTSWRRWRELTDFAHLVIMRRPGYRVADLPDRLAQWVGDRILPDAAALREHPAGGVLFHTVSPLDISATAVRRWIARGFSARYLMPDAVWRLVAREGFYGYPQI